MKYIRKNGIKDPGSAITHGTALILAVVGTLPLLLKAAREPDHLHVVAMVSVYAEYDFAVSGEHRVSHV